MLLLSVFLIVLVLLPLSAAIKCYDEVYLDGEQTGKYSVNNKVPVDCESGNCLHKFGTGTSRKGQIRERVIAKFGGCWPVGHQCSRCTPTFTSNELLSLTLVQCCCVGELCNESTDSAQAAQPPARTFQPPPPAPVTEQPPPASTGSSCYTGTEGTAGGKVMESKKNKEFCASGVCSVAEARVTFGGITSESTTRLCMPVGAQCIDEKKCLDITVEGVSTTTCCCNGDLCNESVASIKGEQPSDNSTLIIIACSVGGIILAAVVIGAIICLCKKKRPVDGNSGMNMKTSKDGMKNNTRKAGNNEMNSDVESAPSDL